MVGQETGLKLLRCSMQHHLRRHAAKQPWSTHLIHHEQSQPWSPQSALGQHRACCTHSHDRVLHQSPPKMQKASRKDTHLILSSTKSTLVPMRCIRAAGSIRMRTPFCSISSSNLPLLSAGQPNNGVDHFTDCACAKQYTTGAIAAHCHRTKRSLTTAYCRRTAQHQEWYKLALKDYVASKVVAHSGVKTICSW